MEGIVDRYRAFAVVLAQFNGNSAEESNNTERLNESVRTLIHKTSEYHSEDKSWREDQPRQQKNGWDASNVMREGYCEHSQICTVSTLWCSKQIFGCSKAEIFSMWHREFIIGGEQQRAIPMLLREDHFLTLKLREGRPQQERRRAEQHPHQRHGQTRQSEAGEPKSVTFLRTESTTRDAPSVRRNRMRDAEPVAARRRWDLQNIDMATPKARAVSVNATTPKASTSKAVDRQDNQEQEN